MKSSVKKALFMICKTLIFHDLFAFCIVTFYSQWFSAFPQNATERIEMNGTASFGRRISNGIFSFWTGPSWSWFLTPRAYTFRRGRGWWRFIFRHGVFGFRIQFAVTFFAGSGAFGKITHGGWGWSFGYSSPMMAIGGRWCDSWWVVMNDASSAWGQLAIETVLIYDLTASSWKIIEKIISILISS